MKAITLFLLFLLSGVAATAQLSEKTGIGVRMQLDTTRGYTIPRIIGLVPTGSALPAGLLEGDYILQVNNAPTRDRSLQEVADMIVGDEGTAVSVQIERGGLIRDYKMLRIKYQYTEGFYVTAEKEDAFCTALTTLMNDAGYDFANTMDTTKYVDEAGAFGRRYFESRVKIPGTENVSMASSFGTSCIITVGTFSSEDAVNDAGEKLVKQLQVCFPEYYIQPVVNAGGSNIVQVGESFSDGFESAIIEMYSAEPSGSSPAYKLTMRINGGKPTRYYQLGTEAEDNPFITPLRTLYNDVLNKFNSVKSTKHEIPASSPFGSATYWYEVNPMPAGAHDCSIQEGGLTSGSGCNCRFFLGENREEAVKAYETLFDMIRQGLGSDYVYMIGKPDLDMSIPSDAQTVVIFGIKKTRTYESAPLLALIFTENVQHQFGVSISLHKFGF